MNSPGGYQADWAHSLIRDISEPCIQPQSRKRLPLKISLWFYICNETKFI